MKIQQLNVKIKKMCESFFYYIGTIRRNNFIPNVNQR